MRQEPHHGFDLFAPIRFRVVEDPDGGTTGSQGVIKHLLPRLAGDPHQVLVAGAFLFEVCLPRAGLRFRSAGRRVNGRFILVARAEEQGDLRRDGQSARDRV